MKTHRRGSAAGSRHLSTRSRQTLCGLWCATLIVPGLVAGTRNLGDLSIEELLNESVTSVSKREQKLGDVASAIAVLSNDELRRSGATTIADALRLVPGVYVGSVSASQWSVSARGFNGLYANKLLVLVDGRAVYTPIFAGVYWDVQQPMLEDVERVEVIRGPGASVWGANAVNGVINVVSRSARDTQGSLIYGGGGEGQRVLAGVRHGDRIGEDTYYRVYASHQANDGFVLANGAAAGDEWHGWTSGFRVDHYPEPATQVTWQTDASVTDLEAHRSHARNLSTLGRWTRELGAESSVEAQMYYDRLTRNESLRSKSTTDTIDFTLEHRFAPSERQDMMWGVGYRWIESSVWKTALPINTEAFDLELFSAFVQDEVELVPEVLAVTAGVKFEHNDFTGSEVQPSVRAMWKPTGAQRVWAAVARSVRTPSALEAKNLFEMELAPPMLGPDGGLYVPTLRGNGDPYSEVLWSYEAGWRMQVSPRVSVDLATFYNRYDELMTWSALPRFLPGASVGVAEISFVNGLATDAFGGEIAVTVAPTKVWRISASYSALDVRVDGVVAGEQYDPKQQAVLRSSHEIGRRVSVDFQLRYVGGFNVALIPMATAIPSYVGADVRIAYRPNDAMEISVVGQDLLDDQHPEQGPAVYSITSEVPRRVYGKVTWRF